MRLKKDSSKQKLRGAYYTPQKLANAMVRLFASENIDAVLEPSCGDGVFLDALKETGLLDKVSRVEAVEIHRALMAVSSFSTTFALGSVSRKSVHCIRAIG